MKSAIPVEKLRVKPWFSIPKPVFVEKSFIMADINGIAARKITSADGNQFVQYLCLTKSFIH